MALSKITSKRQVVIPEAICRAMGAKTGDFIEFVPREGEILVRLKKVVDARPGWEEQGALPPAPSREERNRLLDALQGDAQDDSGDISIDEIKATRTISTRIVEFD